MHTCVHAYVHVCMHICVCICACVSQCSAGTCVLYVRMHVLVLTYFWDALPCQCTNEKGTAMYSMSDTEFGSFLKTPYTSCALSADPSISNHTLKAYLTGWDSDNAGLVVLEYQGVNGTVCGDRFDLADGDVLCRMLGYSHALEVRGAFNFFDFPDVRTSHPGPIWIDDLSCNGSERTIEDCSFPGWGINDCSHYEDVSLICASMLCVCVCVCACVCECVCACVHVCVCMSLCTL